MAGLEARSGAVARDGAAGRPPAGQLLPAGKVKGPKIHPLYDIPDESDRRIFRSPPANRWLKGDHLVVIFNDGSTAHAKPPSPAQQLEVSQPEDTP